MSKQSKTKVGYKQPPKSGQWKKGQSGNPSGKKKQPAKPPQLPLIECLAQQLKTPVEMTTGGEKVSVPFGTALSMKLLHDLMGAPLNQKLAGLALLDKLGVLDLHKVILETEPDEEEPPIFSDADRRMLKFIMSRESSEDG